MPNGPRRFDTKTHLISPHVAKVDQQDVTTKCAWFQIKDLSWRNCGPENDGLKLRRLDFDPEVIRLPGTVTATYAASLMEDEAAPIHVSSTQSQ